LEDEERLHIDPALLKRILRKRRYALALGTLVLFATLLLAGVLILPQTYTSTTSMSIQRAMSPGSDLLHLIRPDTGSLQYKGVLHSRKLAAIVENRVNVMQALNLHSHEEAIGLISQGLLEEEKPDGLVYVSESLNGAPLLLSGGSAKKALMGRTAAQVANTYVAVLREYMTNTDNNQGAVLRRAAEKQLLQATTEFQRSFTAVRNFIHKNRRDPIASAGYSQAPSELSTLETALLQAQADLQSRTTAMNARRSKIEKLAGGRGGLTTEDDLMKEARSRVASAELRLKQLRVQFGEAHPQVRRAREDLRIAEGMLEKERSAVVGGKSSEQARAEAEVEGLQRRYDTVRAQVDQVLKSYASSRDKSMDFEYLRRAMDLQFEVLKATETSVAGVRASTVAPQSQIISVDEAIPSRTGSPAPGRIALVCAILAIAIAIAGIGLEYLVLSYRARRLATLEQSAVSPPQAQPLSPEGDPS